MGERINGYITLSEFTTNNSGLCQWTFARKNGRDYFIKRFLKPKYPTDAAEKVYSVSIVNAMKAESEEFYLNRKQFYDKLSECRTGNVVVIQDFFREDESYYIVTEKMQGPFLEIAQIARLTEEGKRTLFKAVLYSLMQIHDRGIVHSDLKPQNILIKQTAPGYCTAKLIDFDSGYFEYGIPKEITGDQHYFSPEAILRNYGREVPIGVKSDIFALGLLFHQYWCGEFPTFLTTEYDFASVALLNHSNLVLSPSLPADVSSLISRMLSKYQDQRPSAREAWEFLSGKHPVVATPTLRMPTNDDLGFHMPLDDDL